MDVQTCPAHSQADHANMQSCLAPYQPGLEILKVRGYEQEINPKILTLSNRKNIKGGLGGGGLITPGLS